MRVWPVVFVRKLPFPYGNSPKVVCLMSVPASKYIWRVLAISSALIFAYATVLAKLGHDWWTDENYSHGLLIPFVIGFILWSQRDRLTVQTQRPMMLWGMA